MLRYAVVLGIGCEVPRLQTAIHRWVQVVMKVLDAIPELPYASHLKPFTLHLTPYALIVN